MNRLSYTFLYGRNGKSFFFILRKVSIDFPIKSTNVTEFKRGDTLKNIFSFHFFPRDLFKFKIELLMGSV